MQRLSGRAANLKLAKIKPQEGVTMMMIPQYYSAITFRVFTFNSKLTNFFKMTVLLRGDN